MDKIEKKIAEIGSVGFDMLVELNGILMLADTIDGELFGGREADEMKYRVDYPRLQALNNMLRNALYKFEGEFSLLIGEDETPYYEAVTQRRPGELREINEWWHTPRKVGKAV